MPKLDRDDLQALIARGFSELPVASYLLLQVDDAAGARAWLQRLLAEVTSAATPPADSALNVAFTAPGLAALGVPAAVLDQFSNEFTAGMTTPHRRRMFGDSGSSAPEQWRWGGPSTPEVHLLLLLFARDVSTLRARQAQLSGALRGVRELARLDAVDDLGGKEHFGFTDGISQPTIDGLSARLDIPSNTILPGEFILGYSNEYGLFTERPLLEPALDPAGLLPGDSQGSGRRDLGRNGTYLVFRQLAQDVRGFWGYLNSVAGDDRVWLAAKMVGRWPGGAPMTLSPERDDPQLARANDFTYQYADAQGLRCPIGAHVRRAHPRDSLDPGPGTERSVALDKRHRLLRRGREYGPPVDDVLAPAPPDDPERGLYFICLAGNIARQFEFVQFTWVNNPKFDGLYGDPDPIVGPRDEGDTFTLPAEPVRQRLRGLPRFVSVRGGAYFFLPGLRALRYLAAFARSTHTPQPPAPCLRERGVTKTPPPPKIGGGGRGVGGDPQVDAAKPPVPLR